MEGLIERVGIDEGLVGEMMGLEIAPDGFDVTQLRGVFGQLLDGEPVDAGSQGCSRDLAGVDWSVVFDQHHRFGGLTWLGTVDPIKLFEVGDKVAAAFGLCGMHDEFAGLVVERYLLTPYEASASVIRWEMTAATASRAVFPWSFPVVMTERVAA
jgi:hypothetical protein